MGQGYYYTLSAVAQSFAAIIALDAIFVVFRLKTIQDTIDHLFIQTRKLIVRDWTKDKQTKFDTGAERQIDKWTLEQLSTWLISGEVESNIPDIIAEKNVLCNLMNENHRNRETIMNWLYVTLVLNAVTIISSLMCLVMGKISSPGFQYTVVGIILALASFALVSTMHAILITVGRSGIDPIRRILVFLVWMFGFVDFANKLDKWK